MRAMKSLLATATVLVGATTFSTTNEAEDRVCITATSQDVRALYAAYAETLRRGDVEALTALYSPDAILMGPAEASIRLGRAEIAGYYTSFLRRRPSVVPLERVVRTECGALTDMGVEALSLQLDGPALYTRSMTARFSLSYARFGEQWLIVHHHQEMIDERPSLDVAEASIPASHLITGTNPPADKPSTPPATPPIVLPPQPLALPSSAPVILTGQRPLLPKEEEARLDSAAIRELLGLAQKTLSAVDVGRPRLAFTLGLDPPSTVAPKTAAAPPPSPVSATVPTPGPAQAPATAPVDVDPPRPIAKEPAVARTVTEVTATMLTPPLASFGLPAHPPSVGAIPLSATAQVETPPAGSAEASVQPAKPAVAGFMQRAAPAASRPPARAAALPKAPRTEPAQRQPSTAAKAPPPGSSGKTGKFLHWDDRRPIFDD